jgi:hypothetical protein
MNEAVRKLKAELSGMKENIAFHQSALSSGILPHLDYLHHSKLKKKCEARIGEIKLLLRSEKD